MTTDDPALLDAAVPCSTGRHIRPVAIDLLAALERAAITAERLQRLAADHREALPSVVAELAQAELRRITQSILWARSEALPR